MKGNFYPSNNIVDWLNYIVKDRFSNDISLNISYKKNKNYWILSKDDNNFSIEFPIFENLYLNGMKNNMDNYLWEFNYYNYSSITNNLVCPGFNQNCKDFNMIKETLNSIIFSYDVIGLIYWMLARCEEVNFDLDLSDSFNRFPAELSHGYKHNYLDRPIVDEWINFLRFILKNKIPEINLKPVLSKLNITHDVDVPSRFAFCSNIQFLRLIASLTIKHRQFREVFFAFYIRLCSKFKLVKFDSNNSFEWLMDVSEEYDLKSKFYFIAGGNSYFDADYSFQDKPIRKLLKLISQREHYLGIHPSFESYLSYEQIKKEFMNFNLTLDELRIKNKISSNRMHYLKWSWPSTAIFLDQLGIKEDSTLGFSTIPGFRCGTSYSYKMFDPLNKKVLNLIQTPLLVMDTAVLFRSQKDFQYEDNIIDNIKKLYLHTKYNGGKFTLNWHNDSLRTKKYKKLYLSIIRSLKN